MTKTVTIEQFEKEVIKDLEALHRGIGIESAKDIVDNAPVDTGKLKGSINLSKSDEIITDNPDPSGSSTKIRIENNGKSITIQDTYYVNVGEPYAKFVDEGTSKQSPTGFFSTVATNLNNYARRVKENIQRYRK